MKQRKQLWTGCLAGICMVLLILDAKTAFNGAAEGVSLCIRSVIPSLFPYLILTNLINNALIGKPVSFLKPIRKLCGIPEGGESLLLLGLLGGYPVGAQCVATAYKNGQLKKRTALRMLGFCSNAGPAFIFGLTGTQFASAAAPWVLWGIHIISALTVGVLLPQKQRDICSTIEEQPMRITKALERSVRIISNICGWVIIFRVIIAVCDKWFLWLFSQNSQVLLTGLLELTNGIATLHTIPRQGVRFVICSCMLGIGGVCVGMQTLSVTENLEHSLYFPGKALQGIISLFLSSIAQLFLFHHSERMHLPVTIYCVMLAVFICIICYLHKKSSRNATPVIV